MEKVTLYIPCYNAEKHIEDCLKGVMRQTYPIDEILVIDDGSNDRTVEIASKYPVKIIRHGTNKGLAAARNTAFKNARNEFVAALDADCVPEPDWLEKLMKNFTNERAAGVGGKLVEKHIDSLVDKWRAIHLSQHWGDERVINPEFLFGSNNVFLKKAVADVGYFNERFKTNYEDVDLSYRLKAENYALIYEPIAIAEHLLKDSLSSVFHRWWRWHYSHKELNNRQVASEILRCVRRSVWLIASDLKSKHFSLIPLDVLFAPGQLLLFLRAVNT